MTCQTCSQFFLLLLGIATFGYAAQAFGELKSPSFPSNYQKGKTYDQKIPAVGKTNRLQIHVTDMSLAGNDMVYVYDENQCKGKVRKSYDRQTKDLPDLIFLSNDAACVRFERSTGGAKGWRIEYTGFPKCGGTYTSVTGNIMNPNYPYNDYANNQDCKWRIQLGKGQKIEFAIQEFVLDSCAKSSVTFTNIQGHANNELKLCNKPSKAIVFKSLNEESTVSFQSGRNFFTSQKGFWIKYRALGCKEEDIPAGGKRVILNKSTFYDFGYVLKFKCQKNYQFPNGTLEAAAICKSNDKTGSHWDGLVPECGEIYCGDPGVPVSGEVTVIGDYGTGSTAQYTCLNGTSIVGNEIRECDEHGNWTGELPYCKHSPPGCCDDPGEPGHGAMHGNNFTIGSQISFTCDIGYILIGATTLHCIDTGLWDAKIPYCQIVECPSLDNPTNGHIEKDDFDEFGDIVTYKCDDGFRIKGSEHTRTCTWNGTWSLPIPKCEVIACGVPAGSPYGSVTYTGVTINSTANYSCNAGFQMDGPHERTCLPDGTWSGDPPMCIAYSCKDLKNISNGDLDMDGNLYTNNATFTCHEGFHMPLTGNPTTLTVTCLMSGNWSATVTECIPTVKTTTSKSAVTSHVTSKPTTSSNGGASGSGGKDSQKGANQNGDSSTGLIIGGVLLGIVFVLFVLLTIWYIRAKRKANEPVNSTGFENPIYASSANPSINISSVGAVEYSPSSVGTNEQSGNRLSREGGALVLENSLYGITDA
ncbi:P-selectin-like [Tubulanus polymorphus]|uniref:P-selectin-like n=1 Tax=Tubulanus polymorphus TaxID=672921 RepID=UPI003DA4D7FC